MNKWSNWSGDVQCAPDRFLEPETSGEVASAVKAAAGRDGYVRVAGSGHSFSPVVASDSTLLSLQRMSGVLDSDHRTKRATLAAGTAIRDLGEPLARRGMALVNQGDVHPQAIAGAIATGTHGTGWELGSLSTTVTGFKLVTGTGEVIDCTPEQNSNVFEFGRVSLGGFGVMTELEMQMRESYKLKEIKRNLPFQQTLDEAEASARAYRHWEFHWFPYSDLCATKVMDETDEPVNAEPVRHFLVDVLFENSAWFGLMELTKAVPKLNRPVAQLAAQLFSESEKVDWSYKVFPNPRFVKFNEMEYAVPAEVGPEVLLEIRHFIEREQLDVAFPIEYRYVAADDIPLSPFYQRDSAVLSCHVYAGKEYDRYFRGVEKIFRKHGGRPHWGKINTLKADDFREIYPRYDEFQALRAELDPKGVFESPYLRRIFGSAKGAGKSSAAAAE